MRLGQVGQVGQVVGVVCVVFRASSIPPTYCTHIQYPVGSPEGRAYVCDPDAGIYWYAGSPCPRGSITRIWLQDRDVFHWEFLSVLPYREREPSVSSLFRDVPPGHTINCAVRGRQYEASQAAPTEPMPFLRALMRLAVIHHPKGQEKEIMEYYGEMSRYAVAFVVSEEISQQNGRRQTLKLRQTVHHKKPYCHARLSSTRALRPNPPCQQA
ncbi:hypothetical protein GGR56DRAFT_4310 [Xylariaceae sp. FL0804]|nr:hypothetical protein GGR56DRAFT_4310 [Xylariaceae sp. FL0804]